MLNFIRLIQHIETGDCVESVKKKENKKENARENNSSYINRKIKHDKE